MPGLENPGKLLMAIGALLLGIGAVLTLGGKVGWLGRLPGDFRVQRGGFSFYFPLATSLLLSLLLTLLLNLFLRRR
jgi:membrane protein implicated in regulation of membrane protease activity